MKNNEIIIYTDGASRGNPGLGGWAAVILSEGKVKEIAGNEKVATNNQMELAGALHALSESAVKQYDGDIVLHSDSAYVVNGLNSWVWGWEKKGWMTIQKTPVENKLLWQKLLALLKTYGNRLTVAKVSGHSGELYNERCDELAVAAALGKKPKLFKGSMKEYDAFLKEMGTTAKQAVSKSKKSDAPAYSYVSLVNGKVHVDKTWKDCERRVKGKKGAKFKKVFSQEEETSLVQDYTLSALVG